VIHTKCYNNKWTDDTHSKPTLQWKITWFAGKNGKATSTAEGTLRHTHTYNNSDSYKTHSNKEDAPRGKKTTHR